MRKTIILYIYLVLHVFNMQSQQFNWATYVTGDSYEYGTKIVKDTSGNLYIIGYSTGTPFEFESVSYPANGRGDAFFAKLDSNKNLVWMKSIGGDDSSYFDEALDMHIDPFGDIYLTFKSSGNNFTYDGQILSGINSAGQYSGEAVLLKVNSNGDYIWHDSGTVSSSFQAITTDASGNLYLTGYFRSTITLGETITLTNTSTGTTTDLLVAKYQPDGTILWAKNAGGLPHNTFAYGYDIEINPQSNELILLGTGDGEVYFDGIPMPLYESSDRGTVLISYTLDGTQNWVKRILDLQYFGYSYCKSLDISPTGLMGVCGYNTGSDPDGLVGFYTSDGSVISEHLYPSSNYLKIHSITFNDFNEAYISGEFNIDAVLGTSPETVSLSGTPLGFIAKLDIYHQIKWVMQFESTFESQVLYNNGEILYAGRIDDPFIYNFDQDVITNNRGDALFGEVIDYQLSYYGSNITGRVFQDLDDNCILDFNEIAQKSVIVKAVDNNGLSYYSVTDLDGFYDIHVDTGSYTVEILPNPIQSSLIEQSCYTQQAVLINELGEDAINVNFPLELYNCPLLNVDISSDRRRRCFENNTYVFYSNQGFADANNVQVIVQLPEYVNLVSSDHSYTIDAEGNYVFNIGSLAQNESGIIHIVDTVECIEGITGLTQCTQAWILPKNDCADALDPDFGDWDKSSVGVKGSCLNNTIVQFTITNTGLFGEGDMQNAHEYRIYVDNELAITSTFQLNGGESITIDYPANGQTIRLEADQHPMHPGDSHPQATVEGCGTNNNGEISTGFVDTMPMDDLDIDVEIQCLEIVDSFDPNDKAVSPSGITENHYVKAGTTLDYMIRFQNTGTDIAYTVVIEDTLSEYLDPSTIQWGISSHPYTIKITGTETPVLEFTFNNINLPDSTSDELGSHGFVKFKASTYNTLENGIEVNNNANIYFDYNLPILTNTAQVIISDKIPVYNPLSIQTYVAEDITIYPNPTTGLLVIETNNLQEVKIYNIRGQLLKITDKNQIDLSQYAKGIYLVKINTNKGTAVRKIILK